MCSSLIFPSSGIINYSGWDLLLEPCSSSSGQFLSLDLNACDWELCTSENDWPQPQSSSSYSVDANHGERGESGVAAHAISLSPTRS